MASWKKVLVSGSNISELNNDLGFVASAGLGILSSSVQVDHDQTTNFVANEHIDHTTVTITAGSGLTGGGDISATRTINVGAGDGISVAADAVAVDATVLRTTGQGIVSSSAQIDHDQTTNFDANEHFTQANITTVGTVTAGSVTAILPAGTVSSSAQIQAGSITGDIALGTQTSGNYVATLGSGTGVTIGSNTGEGSSPTIAVNYGALANTAAQGNTSVTFNGTANEIELSTNTFTTVGGGGTVTIGLPNDVTIGNNLTVGGNLTVSGDLTYLNTTNLLVEDPFILLASGSAATGDSGIIFGGSEGTANSGNLLFWDASYNSNDGRLSIATGVASNATGAQTPAYSIAGVFEGTEANAATAQADHPGNIRIESGDIFIYV